MQAIIDREVTEMEQAGVIEPSQSPWSSPVVIVRKKDGKPRFCIDFRRINQISEKDAYPLPQVQATLDKLRGATYLSTLDLKNGYWQVPLTPESKAITAFTVPGRGLMQFRVLPFGLHSAPATFQRLLDRVLGPELEPNVFVYLDDIIIVSKTFNDHLKLIREVCQRLRHARLRLNIEKCRFCVNQLKYLGHLVDHRGIHTDPDKIDAIRTLKAPTNIREIRRFLGTVSWYRRFIKNFSRTARPLTQLLHKKAKWKWTEEEEIAFQTLKQHLITAPVLACPDFGRPFTLQTDASEYGLGAVLTQEIDHKERVIAYASRTLNNAEKNYSVTEKECLAIIWGIRKMRPYLEGYHFTVLTDHQALKWLQKIDSPTGRLARWALELQQFDFEIKYRKGSTNQVADALSRQPTPDTTDELCYTLPDTTCPWYRRIKEAVTNRPTNYPEYNIINGRLYRLVLTHLEKRT
jgi:Reverse transcriptase (RNA-dependent DNA polymerase).